MYERRPSFQLFRCLPGIIQDPLINEFDLTFRSHRASQTGNAIDDEAETPFARTQGLLRKLCGRDVRHCAYELKMPGRCRQRAGYNVEVLDGTVWHQQTVLQIKVGP